MIIKTQNVYVIDKPLGIGSNDVIQKIKTACQIKKIGHGGTLDPLATGVLVIGINNGTKALGQQLDAIKEYIVTMEFGYQTDTLDNEGKVVAKAEVKALTIPMIEQLCQKFKTDYQQTVPKYSAVKYQGQELYKLARANLAVPEIKKSVKLLDYEILDLKANTLLMRLSVSKGFYVRSFCNDLGLGLDTFATMTALRRIKSGDYTIDQAYQIDEFITHYQSLHKREN